MLSQTNRTEIEKRIMRIETSTTVFRRKSEEYKNYCLCEYKKILENNVDVDWYEIIHNIEGKAKELNL